MQKSPLEVRRAFGILFVGVAISVGTASILSEISFEHKEPIFYYAIIWFGSFAITFGIIIGKFRSMLSSIRGRMKNSVTWPPAVKAINGLCWAAPFAMIGVLPHYYQYLILFGIGLGNTSTFFFMKKFSNLVNLEQIIVGAVSLAALPLAVIIDTSLISNQTTAVITSRIMIAIAYGAGGIFALVKK
ncbi:conserved membrane hypothetical protein [Nitrosotalea sinensis]|uniref:Uncharacterized protein n=1 Tax=Nitrosotalea sinensis TaxID=1499975 RepID=A0A2H1EHV6_9ARCH|nr:hypothetical protein [Candidatus Nitrosotalea sinensis]SHO46758.1 conserved membrane hypothetical protein [Candidatus Nitrosotalea sinensis]